MQTVALNGCSAQVHTPINVLSIKSVGAVTNSLFNTNITAILRWSIEDGY